MNRDIKYLLLEKFYQIEKLSLQEAEKSGLKYRNMVFGGRIFTLLQDNRLSISELSRVIGISRQAVHKSIKIMIEDGLVETVEMLDNRKVKVVQLTEFGKDILKQRDKVMEQVESRLIEKIGEKKFLDLKSILDEKWDF